MKMKFKSIALVSSLVLLSSSVFAEENDPCTSIGGNWVANSGTSRYITNFYSPQTQNKLTIYFFQSGDFNASFFIGTCNPDGRIHVEGGNPTAHCDGSISSNVISLDCNNGSWGRSYLFYKALN
jgi:hypothetical protein